MRGCSYRSAMATDHLIPPDIKTRYHVKEWRNATGILTTACPAAWADILAVLRGFKVLRSEVVVGGGNRSLSSRRTDGAFYDLGWSEKGFATSITVDDRTFQSPTHAVACVKGSVALDVEWNNKYPFFDHDLNNFRLLFDLRANELQNLFKELKKGAA